MDRVSPFYHTVSYTGYAMKNFHVGLGFLESCMNDFNFACCSRSSLLRRLRWLQMDTLPVLDK